MMMMTSRRAIHANSATRQCKCSIRRGVIRDQIYRQCVLNISEALKDDGKLSKHVRKLNITKLFGWINGICNS